MDQVVLRRLVEELSGRLAGQRVDQIYALPRYHVALVVSGRGAPRLWFSAEPDDPHLYLRDGGQESPARPPAFAMAARKWARGQRIDRIATVGEDRVVEVVLSGRARIVFELVPRRASAFVVDPDDTVVAVWNPRRGRPGPGAPWVTPERRERTPPESIPEAEWTRLAGLDDERQLVGGLIRAIAGMSPLVAREVAARRDEGRPLRERVAEELERADRAPTEARVYAPAPPGSLRDDPGPGDLVLAPYPLRHAAALHDHTCADLIEAAALLYATRARLERLGAVRTAITAAARSRRQRLERTRSKVLAHAATPEDPERFRRRGDLLLAAPHTDTTSGKARVPDVHGDGSLVDVEVEPTLSAVDNAQRYYRRAQRAERAARHEARRLATIDRELATLAALTAAADALIEDADCDRLLARAARAGLEVNAERARVAEALTGGRSAAERDTPRDSRRPATTGVRAYRTPSGSELLVGRSARGNDRLTHRMAARDDWWLHVSGPGAHVVLRNPDVAPEPDPQELLVAAAVAAWFSKARAATKAEVSWTRVRDLKRPRGGAPGTVLLQRHRSILVEPAAPEALGLKEIS